MDLKPLSFSIALVLAFSFAVGVLWANFYDMNRQEASKTPEQKAEEKRIAWEKRYEDEILFCRVQYDMNYNKTLTLQTGCNTIVCGNKDVFETETICTEKGDGSGFAWGILTGAILFGD